MPSKRNIFLTSIFRGEKVCLVSNGSKALRAGSSLSALFLVTISSLKLRITGQHDTRPSLYHCRVITTSSVAGGPVIRGTLRSANQISYAFRLHKKAAEQSNAVNSQPVVSGPKSALFIYPRRSETSRITLRITKQSLSYRLISLLD